MAVHEGEEEKMINRTILVGRLVADPELRYSQTGIPVCRFRLAVNRPFANQNGEREADFINCVAWRKQAENLANYMRKGSLVGIDGRIQTGSYEDQDGKKVFYTEVVAESIQFLESKNTPKRRINFLVKVIQIINLVIKTPTAVKINRIMTRLILRFQMQSMITYRFSEVM